jgi:hypothetical protein
VKAITVAAFVLECIIAYLLWRERQSLRDDWRAIEQWYEDIDAWTEQVTQVANNAG